MRQWQSVLGSEADAQALLPCSARNAHGRYLKLLIRLYTFLVRRTSSKFNKARARLPSSCSPDCESRGHTGEHT